MTYSKIIRKIISAFVVVASISPNVYSKPAKPGTFEYIQPDGSIITLSVKGNWRSKTYFDSEGRRVFKSDDGFYRLEDYCRSPYDTDNDAENMTPSLKSQSLDAPGRFNDSFPVEGEQRGLVILVSFTDCDFSMDNPADFYSRMLNERNFSDYGSCGSARDFFLYNSGGVFTPSFDVYGPVTLTHDMKYYGGNSTYGTEKHAYEMIVEACCLIDDEVDLSEYDRDGDGKIDNVYVYYAGYGEADSYQEDTVWPHSWFISYCTNEKHWFDGVLLDRYACSNEMDYGQNRPDGIGTFIHEFSHVMGLPDLYQTDGEYGCFTPGQWSVMDIGSYNNKGLTPPNYSSFERAALGWTSPESVYSSGSYTLDDFGESNSALMIPASREGEWFLFENRQNTGYDAFLPGHGLLVWHIDYDAQVWLSNGVNNDPAHQRVDLVEADGLLTARTRGGDCFPGTSGITSFTKDTSPALIGWDGSNLDFDIIDIYETEEGQIVFNVAVDNTSAALIGDIWSAVRFDGKYLSCGAGEADVFDLTGRKVMTVGESPIELMTGIYVVVCGAERAKIIVR
ncbi:MAG: M6 family metalloprotease domain-containing protein [Bacteroides sp.]|nr:M6 family metalloprotease domain-containing protein [Bacteroides sp.]